MKSNKKYFDEFLLVWERDYRSFMQGVRSAFGVLIVLIIFYFLREPELFVMGIGVVGLTQALNRSPYWRFEFNLFLAYIISTCFILIAFPYTLNYVSQGFYSFFLAFFIYVFAYYKIASVYSIWVFIIPAYSLFTQIKWSDCVSHALMNTVAFLICLFIGTVLFRPRLRKECFYDMKSILREMHYYIESVNNYTFNKSDESANYLTRMRERIFVRIQGLRLIMAEMEPHIKQKGRAKDALFPFFLFATLEERFIETTVGISIKLRVFDVPLKFEKHVKGIFSSLIKINQKLLEFLNSNRHLKVTEIIFIYEQLYIESKKEYLKIEALEKENQDDEFFAELLAVSLQLKDNIGLLNSELKLLCREE